MYRRYSPQNSVPPSDEERIPNVPPARPHRPERQEMRQPDRPRVPQTFPLREPRESAPSRREGAPEYSVPPRGTSRYEHAALNAGRQSSALNFQRRPERRPAPPPPPPPHRPAGKHPLLGFLPPSVYNSETKKLFGFLEAEDLLLIALILMLSENEEQKDSMLIYALLYILLGDLPIFRKLNLPFGL